MNIQNLRYAVEVEKTRSITEAAENLLMSTPTFPRHRELEGALGITIFDRTPGGSSPRSGSRSFCTTRAASSRSSTNDRALPRQGARRRHAAPVGARASYIALAFERFAQLSDPRLTLDYKETNALRSIETFPRRLRPGIVRYQADYEKYFIDTFAQKGCNTGAVAFRYLA